MVSVECNYVHVIDFALCKGFCFCADNVFVCKKIIFVICETFFIHVFLFVALSCFSYWSLCLIIHKRLV